MKKSTCLSLLLIFLALQLRAQTCDTVPFLNTYWANGLQEYSIQNIFPGRNGETWLIGNTVVQPYTVNAADRIFVTKLNARGFPLTTFMLGIQGNITLGSAAQTAEGGFLIVGQAIENGLIYGEAILAKIDTAGHTIWSYGLGKQPSSFANVTPTSDGGAALTGVYYPYQMQNGNVSSHAIVLKFDAKGVMQWGKEFYSKAENEDAGQIVQSPDGNLVIVGNTGQYPNPYFATYIEKMNITTGNEIWGQLIDSVGGYITVSGDGNLIFRGFYDGLAPPGVKGLFFVNNQDGTILSAESFDTPYPGYALSYEYVGAFSDSEELYTGLINNQWPGLLKIKNHKTFEWAQKLPGVTSYGGAHINQNSAAVSYIAQNNIYTAANLITTVLSDTNTKEEYNTYLARTDLNGKSACSDTFAIKLQFTQLPIPQTVACAWYKTYDLSGVDTPSIFAAHLAVSCGIDCYQTTCCRDTMVDKTITFCKGDSYTLPDGSVAAQAGVYTVDLKQASGCDSVVNVTINPIPPTQPQLGDDTCFVDGNPVVLEASAHYAQSYLWQDGSTDSFYNASVPGTYWVQVKNTCGTATDSVVIYPSCSIPIYVPSAFTPNGDGRNDIFRIASMKGLKLLDFSVYNRWGQCVFKTANPQQGWDGTIKGQLSPPGVFVYSIQYVTINGINKSLKGTVVLIR